MSGPSTRPARGSCSGPAAHETAAAGSRPPRPGAAALEARRRRSRRAGLPYSGPAAGAGSDAGAGGGVAGGASAGITSASGMMNQTMA